MNQEEKLGRLKTLDERALRRSVIIPLLGRMGFLAPEEYHGSQEKGKDITCFYLDKLDLPRHLAVVAKTGDLRGSVSSQNSLKEVLFQVEQCFDEPYHDPLTNRPVPMSEVWVITSGRIVPGAWESVAGELGKSHLDKLVRVISGERLVYLLDKHYPTYWNSDVETAEDIRAQRDRILKFLRTLLRELHASSAQERMVLDQLLHSAWIPKVESLAESARVFFANAYSVTLTDANAIEYPKGLVSSEYGSFDRSFQSARKAVRDRLTRMDEIASIAETALQYSDPAMFLKQFDRNLEAGLGDPEAIRALREAFDDVSHLLSKLDSIGQRGRYLALVQSLEELETDIAGYLRQGRAEIRLTWQIDVHGSDPRIVCLYERSLNPEAEGFTTVHGPEVPNYSSYLYSPRKRPIEAADVIESAQYELRMMFERLLQPGCEG